VANEGKVSLIIQIKNLAKAELASFRQSLRNLGAEMKELLSSRLTQALSLGAIALGLRKAFQATDELEQSQRTLAATSQLTGASLEELFGIANRLKDAFSLDDDQANKLTETITRLTVQAGRFNQTQAAGAAFLELGAARGFTVTQTMEALEGAFLGVFRGAQRLIGQPVEELFEAQARAIGVTVGELTQAEKTQALLNAALQGGESARGSFAAWLETAAGRQHLFNLRVNDAQVAVGRALAPLRLLALRGFAFIAGKLRDFIGGIQSIGAELGAFHVTNQARAHEIVAFFREMAASIVEALNEIPLLGRLIPDQLAANMREGAARLRASAATLRAAAATALEEAQVEIAADFNAPPPGSDGGGGITPPVGAPDTRAVKAMQLEVQKLGIAFRDGRIGSVEFAEGLDAIRARAREAADAADVSQEAWTGYQQIIDGTTSSISGLADSFFELIDAQIEAEVQWQNFMNTAIDWREVMTEISQDTLQEFASVIEQTFAAVVDTSQQAGQAFKVAMLQAIAAVVRAMGQMALVEAGENIAKAIANPLQAGHFLAAAAKFAGVAALAFAVAGGLGGAAANAGRGGGGGGAGSLSGQSAQETTGAATRPDATIVINGGLLDVSDPRQADALAAALETLSGRRVIVIGNA
jgi:hypothetical protein